jgi:Bacterial Ig-like domain (group 3)
MTTIRTRPYPDDDAAAAGGLLAAGRITLAAVAAGGVTADRAPHGEPALGPSRPGTATTLTSRATPDSGRRGDLCRYGPPGAGTVAFTGGATPVPGCGAQPVGNAGTATCQVAYPGAGAYEITAAYSGDARHAASTSAALTQHVAYRMQLLGHPAASGTSGPAISVRVVLLDAAGTNVSGPSTTVTGTGVSPSPSPGTEPHGILTAVNLGLWPCYQLTINTACYPAGSYTVSFAAGRRPDYPHGPGRGAVTRRVAGRGRASAPPAPCRSASASRSTAAAQPPPWRARQPAAHHQLSRHEEARPTNPAPRSASATEQVRAGLVLPRFTRRHLTVYPVWSTSMPANTRSPQSRPHGGPACYLARPASLRVTALGRQLQQRLTHRTGKSQS